MTELPGTAALQQGWEDAYAQQGDQGPLWQEDPIPIMDAAVKELRARNVRTVVDLGCGDGRNLAALIDAGFTCTGVDISPTGLLHARRAVQRRGFLLRADAAALPLVSGSTDAVTCFDMFGQVEDPSSVIAEAGRILADDGLFVVNAFTLEDSEYGEGEEIGPHTFAYRDTLFRFFDEEALRGLFDADWQVLGVDRVSWLDPPHGDFRPYEHTHDNWVLYAARSARPPAEEHPA
jgi:SAM-dependent methyltransferase